MVLLSDSILIPVSLLSKRWLMLPMFYFASLCSTCISVPYVFVFWLCESLETVLCWFVNWYRTAPNKRFIICVEAGGSLHNSCTLARSSPLMCGWVPSKESSQCILITSSWWFMPFSFSKQKTFVHQVNTSFSSADESLEMLYEPWIKIGQPVRCWKVPA